MTGEGFRLPLAPPETLGRRFQYAFLSLKPNLVRLDPAAGYAYFETIDDYISLVEAALDEVKRLTAKQRPVSGPRLYRVGRGDRALLSSLGLDNTTWNEAAKSYAEKVKSRGAPLNVSASDLPWLAKATLFGKVRLPGGGLGGRRGRASGITVDTVGSVLLGGSLAYMGSHVLGQERIEFYLVPDAVAGGYANLRILALRSGFEDNAVIRAARLAAELPVSVEVAVSLTMAVEIASKHGSAESIEAGLASELNSVEKTAMLVTVAPQQRPMVRAAAPLTFTMYFSYRGDTLKHALRFAEEALRLRNALKGVAGLDAVAGECINAMFVAAELRDIDALSMCVRDLVAVSETLQRQGFRDLASLAEGLAKKLSWEALSIAEG